MAGYPLSLRVVQAEPGSSGVAVLDLGPAGPWREHPTLRLVPGSTIQSERFVVDASGCSPFLFGQALPPDSFGQSLVGQAVLSDPHAVGGFVLSELLRIQVEAKDTALPPPGAPIPGSPRLADFPTLTRADAVEIRGFASGATYVEVQGPRCLALVPVTGGAPGHARAGGKTSDPGLPGTFRVLVPLAEDRLNVLSFTGVSEEGARSAPAIARIIRDERPPVLLVDSPADGASIAGESVSVAGRVSDALSGLDGCIVTVDGAPAALDRGTGTHGTFFRAAIPLEPGEPRLLTVTATDALGNRATRLLTVTRPVASGPRLTRVGGDAQTGAVLGVLTEPLAVRLELESGEALANRPVRFVVTKSDGRLASAEGSGQDLTVQTDADGVALVHWTLGSDAGQGNNRVEVTSEEVEGSLVFCASALAGPFVRLVAASGDGQIGEAGAPLAEPLRVLASDGRNPVPDLPVTFRVATGDGRIDGEREVVRLTDETGHAQVDWVLGREAGVQLVEATCASDQGERPSFAAEALARRSGERTSASGVVLDPSRRPLGGATCRLAVAGVELETTTDDAGGFRFEDALSGGVAHLVVDGGTATSLGGQPILAGSFPGLSFDLTLVPEARNPLPEPLRLPPRAGGAVPYSLTQSSVLTVEGLAGFALTIAPGSMRVNGQPAEEGLPLTLTPVQYDEIPFALAGGAVPHLAWVLEPAGASFEPPAELCVPNVAGLRSGANAWFLALDADTQCLELTATGAVALDGLTVVSDPGTGLSSSGWGAFAAPSARHERLSLRNDVALVGAARAGREAARLPAAAVPEDRYFTCFLKLLATLGSSVLDSRGQDCVQFVDPASEHLDPAFGRSLYLDCVESYRQCVELILADGERKPSTVVDEPTRELAERARVLADHMLERVVAARNARQIDDASLEVSLLSARRLVVSEDLPATIHELEFRADYVMPPAAPLEAGDGDVLGGLAAFGFEAPSFATVVVERAFDGGALARVTVFELAELPRETASVIGRSRNVTGAAEVELPSLGDPGTPERPVLVHEGRGTVHVSAPEAFQEAFDGQPLEVGSVPLFPLPVFPERITLELSQDEVTDPATPVQARVTGTMDDGSTRDLSLFTDGTSYRSSHPELASIDRTGRITIHGLPTGAVLFTATNQGTTSTGVLQLSTAVGLTTVQGFVNLQGGAPAVGAIVLLSELSTTTTTDGTGFFSFANVSALADTISVRARLDSGPDSYYAARTDVVPVPDGVTDVGILTLESGVRWITLANGSWNVGTNWSSGSVPGASDLVIVDVAGGPFQVTVSGGSFAARKVVCAENLRLDSSGTLSVGELLDVTGGLTVASSGTLAAAEVLLPAGALLSGGALDGGRHARGSPTAGWTVSSTSSLAGGVQMDANISLPSGFFQVTVTGGLTLNGTATLNGSNLRFSGAQSLLGTGEVFFASSTNVTCPSGALTIGPDMLIHGQAGNLGSASQGLLNRGTIQADGSGTISVIGTNWQNDGVLRATGSGKLSLQGNWTNNATIELDTGNHTLGSSGQTWSNAAGGTITATVSRLTLAGNWTNGGSISVPTGTLSLGGVFTQTVLGNMSIGTGPVVLVGTLLNAGQTFDITRFGPGVPFRLNGGTIDGGAVVDASGAGVLSVVGSSSLTSGVQMDADMSVIGGIIVTVTGGLTLHGTATLSGGGNLSFSGAQSLLGTGEVIFASNGNVTCPSGPLTIGQDILIHGQLGSVGSSGQGLLNLGTIQAEDSLTIAVRGTGWQNDGVLRATGGGQLSLQGSWTNNGTIDLDTGSHTLGSSGQTWSNATGGAITATASALTLDGNWTNSGTISVPIGTLNLGGVFTQSAWGNLSVGTGPVNLTGTLQNAGQTFDIKPFGPSVLFRVSNGGRIDGGTVVDGSGTTALAVIGNSSLTSGVQMDAGLTVGPSFASLTVEGGLTLNAIATLNNSSLDFSGTQSLLGTGEVIFVDFGSVTCSGALTIGPDILIHGDFGEVSSPGLVNQGTIEVLGDLGYVQVDGDDWRNDGVIRAAGGGSLYLLDTWTNNGTIELDTGTHFLGGFSFFGFGSSWRNTSAGTITATGSDLNLGGDWTNDGTVTVTGTALTVGDQSFGGTAWTNNGTITVAGSSLTTEGDWTNSGAINVPTGTVNLGGVFTKSAWGNLSVGTGPVNLTGTLQNAGQAFDIKPFGPSVPFRLGSNGRIDGGTVVDGSGTGVLAVVGSSSLTSGVRMDVGMTLSGVTLTVTGNLTLNRTATLTNSSILAFSGAQSLLGTGEVILASNGHLTCSPGPLTIGQNVLIHGQSGSVGASNQELLNRGTIRADGSGTITVRGTDWQNDGLIQASGGGNLSLQGSWTNNGILSVAPTSTIFSTNGFTQASTGKLSVQLGGTVPSLYGSLAVTGPANVAGALEILASGFTLASGNEFQVLTSSGVTGTFTSEPAGYTTEYNSPTAGTVNLVWQGQPAELLVTEVQGPPGGEAGESVPVSWTIQNLGPFDATGPWTDRILASDDAVIGGDVLLGTLDFFGVLAAGNSIQRTTLVTLPDLPGTYRVVLSTDSPDLVFETNEGNNDLLDDAPFQVVAPELPDLVVDSVSGPTGSVVSGSTIQVAYTVRNAGAAATQVPSWRELVFLRDNAQLPSLLSGAVVDVPNQRFLQAGDAYTVKSLVTLPRDVSGARYLGVYVDGQSGGSPGSPFLVEEQEEGNNSRFSSPFQVVLEPQPDLVALAGTLAFPAIAPSGTRIDVTWTERNDDTPPGRGGPTDSGSWRTDVYISTNNAPQIDPGDILLGSSFRSGAPLQPGTQDATRTLTDRLLTPDLSGFFYVKLVVDAGNAISELGFEANNLLVSTSRIEVILSVAPDLEPTAISGTSGAFGQPIAVTWSVHNRNEAAPIAYDVSWRDEVFLSTDAVPSPGTDLLLVVAGQTAVSDGTDLVGDTYTKTLTVTLPASLAPGQYFLIVRVDSANQVFEGSSGGESNNVAVSTPITVSGAMPDLALVANTVPGSHVPASAAPGQRGLAASWTVTNVGSIPTSVSAWSDGIFLVGTGGPTLLRQLTHQGALAPGQSYQVATTFDVPLRLPGSFQLALRTNIGGAVFEGTSPPANNEALLPFQIVSQLPDLVVVSPSGPSTLVTGTPAIVSWTVQNTGTAAASDVPWSDDVYLSADLVLGGGDVPLAGRSSVVALGAGQAYSQPLQATITLPFGTPPGSYYLLVRADSGGRVLELNESNNVTPLPTAVTISGALAANLVVTAVTSPTTVLSGQYLDVTWTVQNTGAAATNSTSWLDSVYLSRDGTLDPLADTLIGTFVQSGALAAGASRQQVQPFHVRYGLQGAYFLFVATNSGSGIFEDGRTADNVGFRVGAVGVDLPGSGGGGGTDGTIDLDLSQVSGPTNAAAGEAISLTWQLGNSGDTALSGAWTNAIYLSADGTLDATDRLVDLYLASVVNLMPVQPQARQRTVIVPAVTPGSYHWIVLADVYDQVPEPEDLNRATSAATTSLTAIPLALGSTASATLDTGEELLFQIDLPASRTVRIDSAHESPGAWIELFARRGAAPTPGVFDVAGALPASATQALVVPDTAADTYYLLVRATAAVQAPLTQVTITATDLPFGVTSVSPPLVGRGRVTLQIGGSRFDGATQFQLRDAGGNDVAASEVEVVDAVHAKVRFELATAPLGNYDIVATSSSDASTLPGALEVEPALPLAVRPEIERSSQIRTGTDRTIVVTLENTTNVDVPLASVVLGTWADPLANVALPDMGIAGLPLGAGETRAMVPLLVRDLAVGTREVASFRAGVDLGFAFAELPVFALARPYSPSEFASGPLSDVFDRYRDEVLADPDFPQFWRDAATDRGSFLASLAAQTLLAIEQNPGPDGFLPGPAWDAAALGVARTCAQRFDPCDILCMVLSAQIQAAASSFFATLPAGIFAGAGEGLPPEPDPLDRSRGLLPVPDEPGASAADLLVLGVFQSHDPNEIVGPVGIGPERYTGRESMSYTVYFENLPTATAPASRVEVTSLLGPEFDIASFRLRRLRVGAVEVQVPVNKSFFRQVVGLQATDSNLEYTGGVRVDPTTGGGEIFWNLQALDPATGTPILNDPQVGILPPEDGTGAGRGFVEFTVRPRSGHTSGTRLETSARIVFDENEVIETDSVFNTLDADPPSSTLALVSLDADRGLLTLSLQGADAPNGAGLDAFVIRASVDGSQYAALGETREDRFELPVEPGRTYALYSQAVDLVRNEEPAPLGPLGQVVPDLVVTVPMRRLVASPQEIDAQVGGTQTLLLDAGPENAGRQYLILGSMSGTQPGTSLSGLHVPLNKDDYLRATLKGQGEIPISMASGVLDGFGRAEVRIELSAALARRLAGRDIHHAFVLLSRNRLAPLFNYVSNPEPLKVVIGRTGEPHASKAPPP